MLRSTHTAATSRNRAPLRRPGAAIGGRRLPAAGGRVDHPLIQGAENARLQDYEQRVKSAFDNIVPVLKRLSALQHEEDFARQAQQIAQAELGFELPQTILDDAWVDQLDMRELFAWCVFQTYRRYCDDFFQADPLATAADEGFEAFLQECGFHTLDITPCADGRLAHLVR